MQEVKSENGFKSLVISFDERNEIWVYAKSILDSVETIKKYPESDLVQGVYLEMLFSEAQAIADFSKAAAKRLGRKTRRSDQFKLVEKANETVELT